MMTITAGSGDKNTYPLDNNSIIRDHMTSEQISNEFNGIRDCELLELIQYFPKDAEEFLLRLRGSQGNNLTTGLSNGQHQRQKNAEIKTHKFLSTHDVEAPFSALTTYRNTFCHLTSDNINNSNYHTNKSSSREISQPILRFGDMPVFTDSILYPGQSRRLLSTTHETFVEKPIHYTEPVKPMPTNLRVEGEQDFMTTNRAVYTVKPINGHPLRRPKISNVPKPCATKPFYGETQFHADFPPERAWNSVNPMYSNVVQPCQPPKAQIQLHQTNERYFHTEQRDQFQRHDVKCNPKSFKHEAPPYTRPSIKLDCYSVTKLDFQPYTPEQILNVNPKLKFGRKIIKNGEGDQPGKLKSQEMRLLKKYLQDLKSAKGQQIPKM